MMNTCYILLIDLIYSYLKENTFSIGLSFFFCVTFLFSMTLKIDNSILPIVGINIIWITSILSIMLSMDKLFEINKNNLLLRFWVLTRLSLFKIILIKLIVYWLLNCIPILFSSIIVFVMFGINLNSFHIFTTTFILGSFSLCLIGGLVNSITIGLYNRGMLIILLIIPMYVPILLLNISILQCHQMGLDYDHLLYIMEAITLMLLLFSPLYITKIIYKMLL